MRHDVNHEEKKVYGYRAAVYRYCRGCGAACAIFINRDAIVGLQKSLIPCPDCGVDYTDNRYEEEVAIGLPPGKTAEILTFGEHLDKFKLYLAINLASQYREEVKEYLEKGIRLKPQGEQDEKGP